MKNSLPNVALPNEAEIQEKIDRFLLAELEGELRETERRFEYFNLKANVFFSDNLHALKTLAGRWGVDTYVRRMRDAFRPWSNSNRHRNIGFPETATIALERHPRILIDVSGFGQSETSAWRRSVIGHLAVHAAACGDAVPVCFRDQQLYCLSEGSPKEIQMHHDDVILMDIASPSFAPEDVLRHQAGHIAVLVNDPDEFLRLGRTWRRSDGRHLIDLVVATSPSRINDLSGGVADDRFPRIIRWRPSGRFDDPGGTVSPAVEKLCADKTPYFLSVGALDLRRGYSVAFSAFEALWDAGTDVRYVIVGEDGRWGSSLEARILHHPEFNKRLFWFRKTNDANLQTLYSRARLLVCAAFDDSEQLAIADAASCGLAAIVPDISVFRDGCNETTRYYKLLDSADLAHAIKVELTTFKDDTDVSPTTWPEATLHLMAMLRESFQTAIVDD